MKNKILNIWIITLIVVLSNVTSIFASYADLTDEEAYKQAQEQIKEQEKEHNSTDIKSSDNYLSELEIEGYTLTPEFDKQTLEYSIKEEVKSNEINIKASTSNNKAKINGSGNIKINKDKNEYRIDVTAENGSTRTYIIKLIVANDNSSNNTDENKTLIESNKIEETKEVNTNTIETENSKKEEIAENKESNSNVFIIIGSIIVIILVLLFFIIVILKGKTKGKH